MLGPRAPLSGRRPRDPAGGPRQGEVAAADEFGFLTLPPPGIALAVPDAACFPLPTIPPLVSFPSFSSFETSRPLSPVAATQNSSLLAGAAVGVVVGSAMMARSGIAEREETAGSSVVSEIGNLSESSALCSMSHLGNGASANLLRKRTRQWGEPPAGELGARKAVRVDREAAEETGFSFNHVNDQFSSLSSSAKLRKSRPWESEAGPAPEAMEAVPGPSKRARVEREEDMWALTRVEGPEEEMGLPLIPHDATRFSIQAYGQAANLDTRLLQDASRPPANHELAMVVYDRSQLKGQRAASYRPPHELYPYRANAWRPVSGEEDLDEPGSAAYSTFGQPRMALPTIVPFKPSSTVKIDVIGDYDLRDEDKAMDIEMMS